MLKQFKAFCKKAASEPKLVGLWIAGKGGDIPGIIGMMEGMMEGVLCKVFRKKGFVLKLLKYAFNCYILDHFENWRLTASKTYEANCSIPRNWLNAAGSIGFIRGSPFLDYREKSRLLRKVKMSNFR